MLSVLSGNLEDEGFFFLQDYVYDKICSSDSLFWASCKQGCAAIAALPACPAPGAVLFAETGQDRARGSVPLLRARAQFGTGGTVAGSSVAGQEGCAQPWVLGRGWAQWRCLAALGLGITIRVLQAGSSS